MLSETDPLLHYLLLFLLDKLQYYPPFYGLATREISFLQIFYPSTWYLLTIRATVLAHPSCWFEHCNNLWLETVYFSVLRS